MSEKIFQQVPAPVLPRYTDKEIQIRSMSFLKSLSNRRTIRDFSDKLIECEVIENKDTIWVDKECYYDWCICINECYTSLC